MIDSSQVEFCRSDADHIRLLAPAGCGKTLALLHRCRHLAERARATPRFLVVTFTKTATHELRSRLEHAEFDGVRDHIKINTLNAYGYRRMHKQLSSTRLLSSSKDKFFAMRNQLRPILNKYTISRRSRRRMARARVGSWT